MKTNSIELGVGLVGIGRPWGYKDPKVPTEFTAIRLMNVARTYTIRYFDTAPSYGLSEERLGIWLKYLTRDQRAKVRIATKFGEHWGEGTPYVDHSYEALKTSLDQSLEKLGKIDVIQLHKSNPKVLMSDDLKRVFEYARSRGIETLGASISDQKSGELALEHEQISLIQLPFNEENQEFANIISGAKEKGKTIVVNRPFANGKLVGDIYKSSLRLERGVEAFSVILKQGFSGYILSGTKSPIHLQENARAFIRAKRMLEGYDFTE